MDVIISIGGREAIPVRAIPLLTDWEELSPDVIARIFAGETVAEQHFEGLASYRLIRSKEYEQVSQREWAHWTVRELDALSESNGGTEVEQQRWRSESLRLLPAGVFVWRDEFERIFSRQFGAQSDAAKISSLGSFEPLALNFNPMRGPGDGWQIAIMEGFAEPKNENAPPETNLAAIGKTPGTGTEIRWTPEKLKELAEFRERHGTKAAAEQFEISGARVRELLPRDNPPRRGNSVFTYRTK